MLIFNELKIYSAHPEERAQHASRRMGWLGASRCVLRTLFSANGRFVLSLLLAFTPVTAFAALSAISMQTSVLSNCMFAGGDQTMSFGDYDPTRNVVAAPLRSASTFTLRCSKGSSATILLSSGLNASGSARRMRTGSGSYLNYDLFRDAARNSVWNDSNAVQYVSSSSVPQTFTIYGQVPSGQDNVAIGSYSDTITITVMF